MREKLKSVEFSCYAKSLKFHRDGNSMATNRKVHSIIIFILVGLFCWTSYGQTDGVEPAAEKKPELVEVEINQDFLASYKERREDHGIYFSLAYESLKLKNFTSATDGLTYEALFGESDIPLILVGLDYKYNFSLGSVAVGLQVGKGEVSRDKSGVERRLTAGKYGVGLKYTVDNILDEPYVAPYVGINFWRMELEEKNKATGTSISETTQMGYNYSLGLLIQLDWVERESAKTTTFNWGLENTFLDIYATQYAKTTAEDDPNTETDLLLGAGLRLEF